MKKFLCMACLMLVTMMAQAANETKAVQPPENDIGIVANIVQVGQTFEVINTLCLQDLQAPVVLNMEVSEMPAQVTTEAGCENACGTEVQAWRYHLRCKMQGYEKHYMIDPKSSLTNSSDTAEEYLYGLRAV